MRLFRRKLTINVSHIYIRKGITKTKVLEVQKLSRGRSVFRIPLDNYSEIMVEVIE